MHQSLPHEPAHDASPNAHARTAPTADGVCATPADMTPDRQDDSSNRGPDSCSCASHRDRRPPHVAPPQSTDVVERGDVLASGDIILSPESLPKEAGQARSELLKLTTTRELESAQVAWKRLDAYSPSPLQDSLWFQEAILAFETEGPPSVRVLEGNDGFVAVAPFVEKVIRGVARRCLAGAGELHEPVDFVAKDAISLSSLLQAISREGFPILLERVPSGSESIRAIESAFRRRAIIIKRPQAACPFIELDDSWRVPESHLNAGRRSDFRRAGRKAERLGSVAIDIHRPGVEDVSPLLDQAFEVEAKSWKGEAGTALIHDSRRARFFREYTHRAAEEGILRICFLTIDGQPAAMQVAIEDKQGFWLLKVGYDQQFRSCSPGLLLMRETIRYSAEKGLRTYEFLGVAEDWTAVWTKSERPTLSLWIYPFSCRGLAAFTADVSSKILSRWSSS